MQKNEPNRNSIMDYMRKLLKCTSVPIIDDIFVNKTGLMIVKETKLTQEASQLFTDLELSSDNEFELSGEFNTKLSYLSFSPKVNGKALNENMVTKSFHMSVYGDWSVTFLITGLSDEILKELVVHREAQVNRFTSSKTKAQTKTFYRLIGTPEQQEEQKRFITGFLELRDKSNYPNSSMEQWNALNLPCRLSVCTFTMTLKDYHKLFIGRMNSSNEEMVREIMYGMATILHERYPLIIKTPSEYDVMSNGEKLNC